MINLYGIVFYELKDLVVTNETVDKRFRYCDKDLNVNIKEMKENVEIYYDLIIDKLITKKGADILLNPEEIQKAQVELKEKITNYVDYEYYKIVAKTDYQFKLTEKLKNWDVY